MHVELDTHRTETFAGSRPASRPLVPSGARPVLAVDGRFLSRGDQTIRLRGVTYGPFAPNSDGQPFPDWETVAADFAQMKAIGVNALRVYHRPTPRFLDLLAEHDDLGVVIDIPWSKHLCFLQSPRASREAREAVTAAARDCRHSPAVLAYSIGNEVPPDIVRWHGARRIERFLRELADSARQADPDRLVTYANYPPTEYLDLSFLDFATFNVYLHDRETFRRYLLRLMNLVGDKPLVLGEIGMDTLRHGEAAQAEYLAGHVREATAAGLAGSFLFSWTDQWFAGGHKIADWAFGLTTADRKPKVSYHALGPAFAARPVDLLPQRPRVSVVVCSYNGGATLNQCLESLLALDYPDYEVLLVDDGSTDKTRSIAARFPQVCAIHQENRGLGAARNAGLHAATGQIVAYTDADCIAHPDWLTHLVGAVRSVRRGGSGRAEPGPATANAECRMSNVECSGEFAEFDRCHGGGLRGRRAGTADARPGKRPGGRAHPGLQHGLPPRGPVGDQRLRSAVPRAGDDVDICWRLQAAGYWISFAPAAMVWHHRRQTPRAYLRQQAGYGEAEALLRFKHPDRFNFRGQGKWNGMLYGASLQGLVLDHAIIYRGTFGTSPFQCIYQPGPSHWAMVPSTLEWHFAIAALRAVGDDMAAVGHFLVAFGGRRGRHGLRASLIVAAMQALQANLPACHEGRRSRLLVAASATCSRWSAERPAIARATSPSRRSRRRRWRGRGRPRGRGSGRARPPYWVADGPSRHLVQRLIALLDAHRCGKMIDTGWSESDLAVFRDIWTCVSVDTVQEEHGNGNARGPRPQRAAYEHAHEEPPCRRRYADFPGRARQSRGGRGLEARASRCCWGGPGTAAPSCTPRSSKSSTTSPETWRWSAFVRRARPGRRKRVSRRRGAGTSRRETGTLNRRLKIANCELQIFNFQFSFRNFQSRVPHSG